MKIGDLIYDRTFQGKFLLNETKKILNAALQARDRYFRGEPIPSSTTILDMIDIVTEINNRCIKNLNSSRPRIIAHTTNILCNEIFSVLSEIYPSILDENLKEKTK